MPFSLHFGPMLKFKGFPAIKYFFSEYGRQLEGKPFGGSEWLSGLLEGIAKRDAGVRLRPVG